MHMTEGSYKALLNGHTEEIEEYRERIYKLAAQVEKLNWMCGYLSETGCFVEEAEAEWERTKEL